MRGGAGQLNAVQSSIKKPEHQVPTLKLVRALGNVCRMERHSETRKQVFYTVIRSQGHLLP